MAEKAVVLLSGGLNSFVAAKMAQTLGYEIVEAICFNYGQKHGNEIDAAAELAEFLEIPFKIFSPDVGWEMTDSLTIEQIHAMEKNKLNNSFWYGRDLMIHLLAASRARALGATTVITGATDGRVDRLALDLLGKTIEAANFRVRFERPFSDTPSGHAFKVAHAFDVWHQALMITSDCLNGAVDPLHDWGYGCGECDGCLTRQKAHADGLEMIGHGIEEKEAS